MKNWNRYLSVELLLASLLIAAFFLPWLDTKILKVIGWEIPSLQKKMVQMTNFFKLFSKNKESIYTTYVVFIIPLLSAIVFVLWLTLKQKTARIFLLITGVFGVVVSMNLFYKLPKAGSGVYLLCITSILSVIYILFVLFQKKKTDTIQAVETSNNIIE